jgi:hypothetical protein
MTRTERPQQEALDCRERARHLRAMAGRAPTKPMADHLLAYSGYLSRRADTIEASLIKPSATRPDE